MRSRQLLAALCCIGAALTSAAATAPGEEYATRARGAGIQLPDPAPDRAIGAGPFERLIIKNVMLVDGEGAPPRGPVHIVVEGDRIARIASATYPLDLDGAEVVEGAGMYALPGFIDAHAHMGTPFQGLAGSLTPPEYVFRLWLAHGITTIRDPGSTMGLAWTVGHAERAEAGEIVAPRIVPYAMFPGSSVTRADEAKRWVQAVRRTGAKGVKLRGGTREALVAVYEEAARLGMGTANHHDQTAVYQVNALDSARLGLDSLEHWYGLPEALFTDQTIQNYPYGYNYADEQDRFGEAGRLWLQAAQPGSERWNEVRDELIDLDLTLVPTFTIYEANRDVARARDAEWHEDYTWPGLRRFFMPDPRLHGSYHFDWTTGHEVAWRENFERWMTFVEDYKNHGGRVVTGSDSGFIFKLFVLRLTPTAYLLSIRIQKAKNQLINGDSGLSQIALESGFYDQSHFSRKFRKETGVTPLAFRKKFRNHGLKESGKTKF